MRTAAAQPAPSVPSTHFFLPMRWQWAASAALLALCLCVTSTLPVVVAVPFASLSPQPTLQSFPMSDWGQFVDARAFCVLNAAGRGISSITAADLAQYAGRRCASESFNSIDLR